MSRGADRLARAAAIVSYADAYASADHPASPMELATEAALTAIRRSGLPRSAITGLLTGREPFGDYRPQWNNIFAAHLNLATTHSTQVMVHAAGVVGMVKHATLAVTSGISEAVLCVQSDGGKAYTDLGSDIVSVDTDPWFEQPYRVSMPMLYAMSARRYMHEFGVTEEDLAATAVDHQRWAVHHPHAAKGHKGQIDVDVVLGSPMIASPLRLWMMCPYRPWGTAGAFIVTTVERARDLVDHPTVIHGFGEYADSESVTDRMANRGTHPVLGGLPSLTTTGAAVAAADAYRMAGMGPSDMDVVQAGSNFAHIALMVLEDLGFCAKGEARELVRAGRLAPGGDLPYNTNGGYLSFGQAGISCGMDSLVEALRQIRGEALGLQVPGARVAMVHGQGGPLSCHCTAILGQE